jgi:hypothetical protein
MLVSTPLPPKSPYLGIEPFRYIDWQIFSAREDEALNLLSTIIVSRCVLVYGESGTGKSSLINAGLVPVALENDLRPLIIRVQPQAGAEIVVERIATTEAGPPYLDSVLVNDDETSARVVLSLEDFIERLASRAKLPSREALNEGLFAEQSPRTLLIFDQFEEFITLFEDARGNTIEQVSDTQERILQSIIRLLRDESLAIKLVLVFRDDYLAKLKTRFKCQPDFASQYLHLLPLRAEGLFGIIRNPFEKLNFAKELSPQLAEEIASKIQMRNEADEINLSEVQIVCLKLWEAPNPDELFQLRGVEGLIQDYLTEELSEFSGVQRNVAIGLLGLMLTASNTRNIISAVDLIKLFQREEDVPEEQLKEALRSLTKTRLVRREFRNLEYFYEITSEFLVPWIIQRKTERQSRLERLKLEKERELEFERERERASQELRLTQEKAKHRLELEQKLAQKKIFFLRSAIIVLAFVMALLLIFGYIARRQHQQVLQAQEGAATEQALNKQIIDILTQLFKSPPAEVVVSADELKAIKSQLLQDNLAGIQRISSLLKDNRCPPEIVPSLVGAALTGPNAKPEVAQAARALLTQAKEAGDKSEVLKRKIAKDKLDAIHQMGDLMRQNKFPRELVLSLLSPTLTAKESDLDVARAVSDLIERASAANAEVAELIANPNIADRLPARIYIQIESAKQSDQANAIKSELEKNSYVVPSTEIVDLRAPRQTQLRYYRKQEMDKVTKILTLLKNAHLNAQPVYVRGFENSTQIRPGHFELWFATQSKASEPQWYVIVDYGRISDEQKQRLMDLVSRMTQAGKSAKDLSAHELSIGPYSKDEAESARQRVLSENLARKVITLRR